MKTSVEEIKKAFVKTKLNPKQGVVFLEDGVDAIGALAVTNGAKKTLEATQEWADKVFGWEYTTGVMHGWDFSKSNGKNKKYLEGYKTGKAAAREMGLNTASARKAGAGPD